LIYALKKFLDTNYNVRLINIIIYLKLNN
jgi:hypothetical protein